MYRDRIAAIIIEIFKEENKLSQMVQPNYEITEYTKLTEFSLDELAKTLILSKIFVEFKLDFNKEDIFIKLNRICDIIDLIYNKLRFIEYCETCEKYCSYMSNYCKLNHSDCLKMLNGKPYCDYFIEKISNNYPWY